MVLNTGAAAKYPESFRVDPPVLELTDRIP